MAKYSRTVNKYHYWLSYWQRLQNKPLKPVTLEMLSTWRNRSNNRTNEDMKSSLEISGPVRHFAPQARLTVKNTHTKRSPGPGRGCSSTQQRASLSCQVELNNRPSAAPAHGQRRALTPRASCLLLFPFWSLTHIYISGKVVVVQSECDTMAGIYYEIPVDGLWNCLHYFQKRKH